MVVMSGDVGCWCALFGTLVVHDGRLCMSARV